MDVRSALVQALEADLVGPFDASGSTEEVLELAPSRWYLTGFLAPRNERETEDPTSEDDFAAGADDEDENEPAPEPEPKQKNVFPASMGMSVFLPPADGVDTIEVTVSFADYVLEEPSPESPRRWRRHQGPPRTVSIALQSNGLRKGQALPGTSGIRIYGELENADAPGLPEGTRALSLFVVNERAPAGKGRADEAFIFQVEMELYNPRGFISRPNRRGEGTQDPDEETADLQFRESSEWAVGHGVAIVGSDGPGPVQRLRTTWIPRSEVRRVETHDEPGVATAMEELASLGPDALAEKLEPLTKAYRAWIAAQLKIPLDSTKREERRASLLGACGRASDRIQAGVELLRSDPEVREAFQLMNRAMAVAARQRSPQRYSGEKRPSWRLFQLAFVLLNLPGISDESHVDRDLVELIYFPTGGGKTEAYLGVIAFTVLLRRLRGRQRPDQGLGVSVLLRYTLRLLTLDQLGRAATLICALELLRQEAPSKLGDVRFSVGLWVGRSATANTMEQAKKQIIEYKNSGSKSATSPFPLTNCPWCGGPLGRDSLVLGPNKTSPEEVVVSCVSPQGEAPSTCAFSPRKNREGLPVVFVDEQIYRELPSFIVATVDKFAMLPFRGETGLLFGRAQAFEGKRCYGPMDKAPKGATLLPKGLQPPELIVQDELHLISGPLGTMVGLYETAIEWLSCKKVGDKTIKPKIIASTATVRNAQRQIGALFGRSMAVFPPPAVDAFETYFARVDRTSPGRLYVGVAAPGRAMKAILLRTYVALLASGSRAYVEAGEHAADAYMTLAGYFNSLRELGGMRRLVEDDVRMRAANVEERVPIGLRHPWGRNRQLGTPVELTSREKAGAIKDAKDRLSKPFEDKQRVDVLLASNMISVGVDIDRLGLMVIAGQPKTTSEYIQASSRVGRQHPGLVVTAFNVRRPRDRSHYERFHDYHQTFYRHVEATSLTPFSGPALERGLTGTLLSMARLGDPTMTPPTAAMDIEAHRKFVDACVEVLVRRGSLNPDDAEDSERMGLVLRERGMKLIESWLKLVKQAREEAATRRSYSRFDKDKSAGRALLYSASDEIPADPDEARFLAPTSMRDVEPSVHLWIERRALGGSR